MKDLAGNTETLLEVILDVTANTDMLLEIIADTIANALSEELPAKLTLDQNCRVHEGQFSR